MAAVKNLLINILVDLGIEDAYTSDGELDPRVQAEWDRRTAKIEE